MMAFCRFCGETWFVINFWCVMCDGVLIHCGVLFLKEKGNEKLVIDEIKLVFMGRLFWWSI
jgi:hypothetical protein